MIACYTDGSAKPNPGPAGAGLYIKYLNTEERMHVAIGHNSNNIGELWAIGAAFQFIHEHAHMYPHGTTILLFTDSELVANLLEGGKSNKLDIAYVKGLRTMYRKLRTHYPSIRIYWIRGHKGIPGNEIADTEANLASDLSKENKHIINLKSRALANSFLPL